LKRLIPLTLVLVVVAVCFTAGSASALTFQDRTCDNSIGKPRHAGTYHFRIRVTDALRALTTRSFVLKVKA
jgi:hypothetical protein